MTTVLPQWHGNDSTTTVTTIILLVENLPNESGADAVRAHVRGEIRERVLVLVLHGDSDDSDDD